MDVEKWLQQVKKMDQLIDAKLAERDWLNARATDISAKPFDGMPHTNTGMVSQTMQNAVINLIMLASEIDKLIDQYIDYKNEVIGVLEQLPEAEYGVLHRYYIRYMTWEQVAEDMGYSVRQIMRIRRNSLKNLENVIACHIQK